MMPSVFFNSHSKGEKKGNVAMMDHPYGSYNKLSLWKKWKNGKNRLSDRASEKLIAMGILLICIVLGNCVVLEATYL